MNPLNPREIAYISSFGVFWGICEITLGFVLHNFKIPLSGLILTICGAVICLTCLKLIEKKRCIIYMAFIAATLKLLSLTTIKIGPIIGIIASAGLAQIVILVLGINLLSFILSAGLMCCWPFIHTMSNQVIFFTPKILDNYQDLIYGIGLKSLNVWSIILILLLIHFVVGAISGAFSWKLGVILINKTKKNENIFET